MFLKDLPSSSIAMRFKAKASAALFKNPVSREKQSVGEVTQYRVWRFYQWDGGSYQELYHCADLGVALSQMLGQEQFCGFDAGKYGGDGSDYSFLFAGHPSIRIRIQAERPVIWSITYLNSTKQSKMTS